MHSLNRSFSNEAINALGDRPYGLQQVIPLLQTLSHMTMEAITFLEGAEYLLDDLPGTTTPQDDVDEDDMVMSRARTASKMNHTQHEVENNEGRVDTTQYGGSTSSATQLDAVCEREAPPTSATKRTTTPKRTTARTNPRTTHDGITSPASTRDENCPLHAPGADESKSSDNDKGKKSRPSATTAATRSKPEVSPRKPPKKNRHAPVPDDAEALHER